MILRVGLTGGIATGKSTVARLLGGLGCLVTDADAIVARLYRPGEAGHQALLASYGREVVDGDGNIDRPKLAAIAFRDAGSAATLNRLIHPLVIAEQGRIMAEAAASGEDRIVVIEATLLLESGGRARFDRIVVVDVDPATQLRRGVARGMDEAELLRRIARQLPRDERLAAADYVIDNNGDAEALRGATERLFASLRGDLATRRHA